MFTKIKEEIKRCNIPVRHGLETVFGQYMAQLEEVDHGNSNTTNLYSIIFILKYVKQFYGAKKMNEVLKVIDLKGFKRTVVVNGVRRVKDWTGASTSASTSVGVQGEKEREREREEEGCCNLYSSTYP